MRKRRHLAPWHRKVLDENELALEGEEAAAALEALAGKPAIYCTPTNPGLTGPEKQG